jgi:hypothetical protein
MAVNQGRQTKTKAAHTIFSSQSQAGFNGIDMSVETVCLKGACQTAWTSITARQLLCRLMIGCEMLLSIRTTLLF